MRNLLILTLLLMVVSCTAVDIKNNNDYQCIRIKTTLEDKTICSYKVLQVSNTDEYNKRQDADKNIRDFEYLEYRISHD